MTVHTVLGTRSYQRSFRIFGWTAIAALLGIGLFSVFEPQETSRVVNVALALLAGGIAMASVVCALILAPKEGMWKLKHAFQWELTNDKIIQRHEDGRVVEIPLNDVKSLKEYRGWLLVGGGEPPKGITISSDVSGFDQLKRELSAHCALTPLKVKFPFLALLPAIAWTLSLVLLLFSHSPVVVLGSGAIVLLLWPYLFPFRRIWQNKKIRNRVLFSFIVCWLLLAWIVFQHAKAVI